MRPVRDCLFAVGAAVAFFLTVAPAEARPQYHKTFKETYIKIPAGTVTCAVCHGDGGKDKTKLTRYAKDLADSLSVKNQKAANKILEALRETEAKPTPRGGTWGDFLNNGLLPPP